MLGLLAAAWASPTLAQQTQPPELMSYPGEEQPPGSDLGDLAKATQNPVADLISLPLQNNLDYDIGPFSRARYTLNVEPVIPQPLTADWNLITRIIVPIVYQPDITQVSDGTSGLGDFNPTLFLAPSRPGRLIWGLGPTFQLPTATQQALGSGKWSIGPAAVALAQPHPWTVGVLVQNLWSFAGEDARPDVNQFLLQYFVNFNLDHGWYLTSQPILTANWEAEGGDEWIVPFGGGLGKIFKLGAQAMNGQVAAYWNAITPDQTPSPTWQLRVQVAFLFPKGKG